MPVLSWKPISGLLVMLMQSIAAVAAPLSETDFQAMVKQYCVDCHNAQEKAGELDIELPVTQRISANSDTWERVVRKIDGRQMPPLGADRPSDAEY